MEGNSASGFQE